MNDVVNLRQTEFDSHFRICEAPSTNFSFSIAAVDSDGDDREDDGHHDDHDHVSLSEPLTGSSPRSSLSGRTSSLHMLSAEPPQTPDVHHVNCYSNGNGEWHEVTLSPAPVPCLKTSISDSYKCAPQAAPASLEELVIKSVHLNVYMPQQTRYQLHSMLGPSVYGCVYKAFDTETQAFVAIKLSLMEKLQQTYTSQNAREDYDILENPLREAQAMQILSRNPSPFVLRIVQEFVTSDFVVHGLVMELAPNGDLFDLSQSQKMSEEQVRKIITHLALGTKHMHDAGIVHLDLSMENVLLDSNYTVKISDFGVSQPIPTSNGGRFSARHLRSKIGYMAPELLSRQAFDGRKADVFSLGVILYCLVFKFKPFKSATMDQPSYKLIQSGLICEYLVRSNSMPAQVSGEVLDLLSRMLVPEERRLTLDEVLAHPFLSTKQA